MSKLIAQLLSTPILLGLTYISFVFCKKRKSNTLWVFLFFSLMIFIGAFLNSLTILSNGFKMPVYSSKDSVFFLLGSYKYVDSPEEAYFPELIDRFNGFNSIFSVGDVLIYVGVLLSGVYLIILTIHEIWRLKCHSKGHAVVATS